jgi:hypothetical protein
MDRNLGKPGRSGVDLIKLLGLKWFIRLTPDETSEVHVGLPRTYCSPRTLFMFYVVRKFEAFLAMKD